MNVYFICILFKMAAVISMYVFIQIFSVFRGTNLNH